jgi:hypothetical protein
MPAALAAEARTIQEVLDRLDAEIERAVRDGSRTAYFACLYRGVTQRVLDGIRAGRFQDGARMERRDVVFANRYLAALAAYQRREPATRSWQLAFDAARLKRLVILQHLLLGMNAHINLDLGIAAARVAPGAALPALKHDFDEISRLLGEMLDDVQRRIARVSPWMGLLDRVGGRSDENICSFCLGGSRDLAWLWAQRFARVPSASMATEVDRLDRTVALLTEPIARPAPVVATALALVRARETNDVARVVAALT